MKLMLSIAALVSITITLWFIDGLVIWNPSQLQQVSLRPGLSLTHRAIGHLLERLPR